MCMSSIAVRRMQKGSQKKQNTAGWPTNLEDSQSKALTLLMKVEQNTDTKLSLYLEYVLTFRGTPRIRLGRRLCAMLQFGGECETYKTITNLKFWFDKKHPWRSNSATARTNKTYRNLHFPKIPLRNFEGIESSQLTTVPLIFFFG